MLPLLVNKLRQGEDATGTVLPGSGPLANLPGSGPLANLLQGPWVRAVIDGRDDVTVGGDLAVAVSELVALRHVKERSWVTGR